MNRRGYLAATAGITATAGVVTVAGNDDRVAAADDPVAVTAPTVARGERAMITVEARSLRSLTFDFRGSPPHDIIQFDDAEFSPPVERTYLALPPAWVWPSGEDVTGEIPVEPPESTPPGEYEYGLVLTRGDDTRTVTESFTVTTEE